MQTAPLPAVDLSLKVLVWTEGGETKISFLAPEALGARYELNAELTRSLSGIDPLTDAAVASAYEGATLR